MTNYLIASIAAVFIVIAGINTYNNCPQKVIVEIGGCNQFTCGVKYTDGTIGSKTNPVIGQTVKVCD